MNASSWPKAVAGAGSVGSSAGTYTACTDVMAPLLGRGDPLLQRAHLRGQRRLVAHGRRHAAQQRRHFAAGLREAEDVVDEQQRVGAGRVAEVLGHRQGRQGHAQTGARRLVHLAEDHARLVDDVPVARRRRFSASCISSHRSLPSRVRSPTPANTE